LKEHYMSIITNDTRVEEYDVAGTHGTVIIRKNTDWTGWTGYIVETTRGGIISIHDDLLDAALAATDHVNTSGTYRVEQRFTYGWDSCWFADDDHTIETTFDSHADAWAEIDDLCSITTFDEPYLTSDFRVVKVVK
jgi:hypothetical protein